MVADIADNCAVRRARRGRRVPALARGTPRAGRCCGSTADARARRSPTPTRSCRRATSSIEDLAVTARHGLGGGHGRRPSAAARVRPRWRTAAAAGGPAGELGVVVLARAWPRSAETASPGGASPSPSRPPWWVPPTAASPRRTALAHDDAGRPRRAYEVTREFATSKDGTRVPINLIYRAGTPRDGTAPALLVRLRRLRDLAGAVVRADAAAVAGAGRRVRRGQHPRRRRVRPRSGTTPAGWPPSRTASTTSSPAPTTSWRRGITSRDRLASWAAPTAGC